MFAYDTFFYVLRNVNLRFGDIPWPPRSPYLSTLNFFLVVPEVRYLYTLANLAYWRTEGGNQRLEVVAIDGEIMTL